MATTLLLTLILLAQTKKPSMDERVRILINQTTKRATEEKAFKDLEALGCSGVPAIIARMDDRRDLPDPNIALINKMPGAWEGRRFYGPKKVVDALDAILNQLTGHTENIYNGGTEDVRAKAVKGWRDWLSKTPPEKRCFADVR
jgi:hypothetical protein